jgi:hypothetical protein
MEQLVGVWSFLAPSINAVMLAVVSPFHMPRWVACLFLRSCVCWLCRPDDWSGVPGDGFFYLTHAYVSEVKVRWCAVVVDPTCPLLAAHPSSVWDLRTPPLPCPSHAHTHTY